MNNASEYLKDRKFELWLQKRRYKAHNLGSNPWFRPEGRH